MPKVCTDFSLPYGHNCHSIDDIFKSYISCHIDTHLWSSRFLRPPLWTWLDGEGSCLAGWSLKEYFLSLLHYLDCAVVTFADHSGGEQSLGETKYIIGDSYTVGNVWASTFGINWRWGLFEKTPKLHFWGKNKALVWLYLQSWTWFDVIIILGIKFWWFSFFLDPLLLI